MTGLLTLITVVLGLIAAGQIVRIYELSSALRKDDKETQVTDKDNNNQGWLMLGFMLLFLGFVVYNLVAYWDVMLPVSASEHGVDIDNLMAISMVVIFVVFFITQPLLFYFSWRYRGNSKNKAEFIEHNNKLELLWTSVPAVVLAGLIIYGLSTWGNIMNPNNEQAEPIVVELYAQQFGWTARYAGADNELGYANVRLIEGTNALGVDTKDTKALDDVITKELHLPVNRPVVFRFRSQDVIHSAYMPHFRAQMNCVPGSVTQFQFTPTVTTKEMRSNPDVVAKVAKINGLRAERGEDSWEFDYLLLCNKICGSAHYNMQMKIVVESEEEYNTWMKDQKTFAESL